ncbi:MAG TPA: hypothetical protein VF096_10775 [Azonexus sp.]
MFKPSLTLIAFAVAAQLAGSAGAVEQDHHHHHHHAFAKDVEAFHAVLAPLWHAQPGAERARNTCAQVGQMEKLAGDIRSGDAKPLRTTLAALRKQCRTKPADIDPAFAEVHEAFHRLIEH